MLNRVKTILAIEPSNAEKDTILNEFISNFSNAVNLYCGTTDLPLTLEFIVVEAVIARYNRLGSEGLTKEDIDVISLTYQEEILKPYMTYMDAYKSNNKSTNTVLFL
jgi:Phage gp6-like head-tail connector protein